MRTQSATLMTSKYMCLLCFEDGFVIDYLAKCMGRGFPGPPVANAMCAVSKNNWQSKMTCYQQRFSYWMAVDWYNHLHSLSPNPKYLPLLLYLPVEANLKTRQIQGAPSHFVLIVESLSFSYTANGKRQIQVENFSKYKISRYKQLKTIVMDKKLREAI